MLVFVQLHHLFCSSSPFVCFVPHHLFVLFILITLALVSFVHLRSLFVLFILTACLFCSSSPLVCFVPHHLFVLFILTSCLFCSSSPLVCFVHLHCLFALFTFTACLLCLSSPLNSKYNQTGDFFDQCNCMLSESLGQRTPCCQSPLGKAPHVVRVLWS